MTRSGYLSTAMQLGLSIREAGLASPGRVSDLAALYARRNGLKKK